jgi:hypothetical protein
VEDWVVTGWKMSSVMLVNVKVGFTPVQLALGHPAVAPLTVGAAVSVAALVKVRFPFLIALAGIAVSDVAGAARTLFWPGAVLPPPFWHWLAATQPLRALGARLAARPSPGHTQATGARHLADLGGRYELHG